MLERFVQIFGLPDNSGYMQVYVVGKKSHLLDYPKGADVYGENDVNLLFELQEAGIVSLSDSRAGDSFDGTYGCNPGFIPGKPTDPISILFVSDEADEWLKRRP